MPLLHKDQLIDNDQWTVVADDADLPANSEHSLVSLQRYLALQANGEKNLPCGVLLAPADNVDELAPWVKNLTLVAIDFPVYTDGRGFSHARLLRKRFGYRGELRAVGDIRVDHISFMARSGMDSFDFKLAPDMKLLQTLVNRFKQNYQPSYELAIAG